MAVFSIRQAGKASLLTLVVDVKKAKRPRAIPAVDRGRSQPPKLSLRLDLTGAILTLIDQIHNLKILGRFTQSVWAFLNHGCEPVVRANCIMRPYRTLIPATAHSCIRK